MIFWHFKVFRFENAQYGFDVHPIFSGGDDENRNCRHSGLCVFVCLPPRRRSRMIMTAMIRITGCALRLMWSTPWDMHWNGGVTRPIQLGSFASWPESCIWPSVLPR